MATRQRNARGEGGQLRDDILEAATALVDETGSSEAVTLRGIAKAVGVAAPSLYAHFDDRDALLLAMLERSFNELIAIRDEAEKQAAAEGGGAWERLRAASLATVRFGLRRPGHYKMLFEGGVIPTLRDPKAASFGRPIQARVIELLKEVLDAVPERGQEDAERLSLLLWASTHGVISLQINKPTLHWPDATKLVEELMVRVVRPPTRRAR